MYKCEYCGGEFEEPEIYYEKHGLSQGPYEKWAVCPYCGETDYKEIYGEAEVDE